MKEYVVIDKSGKLHFTQAVSINIISYPGNLRCSVELKDEDGDIIGLFTEIQGVYPNIIQEP